MDRKGTGILIGAGLVGIGAILLANLTKKKEPPVPPPIGKGIIVVNSSPSGASVNFVYPVRPPAGLTPITLEVPPGTYTIVLKLTGYQDYTSIISVIEDETKTIDAVLSPVSNKAYLVAKSTPEGASMQLDDTQAGTTPATLEVTQGSHTLKLSLADYYDYVITLNLAAGETKEINVVLIPHPVEPPVEPPPVAPPREQWPLLEYTFSSDVGPVRLTWLYHAWASISFYVREGYGFYGFGTGIGMVYDQDGSGRNVLAELQREITTIFLDNHIITSADDIFFGWTVYTPSGTRHDNWNVYLKTATSPTDLAGILYPVIINGVVIDPTPPISVMVIPLPPDTPNVQPLPGDLSPVSEIVWSVDSNYAYAEETLPGLNPGLGELKAYVALLSWTSGDQEDPTPRWDVYTWSNKVPFTANGEWQRFRFWFNRQQLPSLMASFRIMTVIEQPWYTPSGQPTTRNVARIVDPNMVLIRTA